MEFNSYFVFCVNASVLYLLCNYSLVSSKLYDYLLALVKSSRTQTSRTQQLSPAVPKVSIIINQNFSSLKEKFGPTPSLKEIHRQPTKGPVRSYAQPQVRNDYRKHLTFSSFIRFHRHNQKSKYITLTKICSNNKSFMFWG